jgi:DNA-3-methyladenine glycosylase II
MVACCGTMALTLPPRGPFSLAAAAAFAEGFPATAARRERGELAFAFAVDGDWRVAGVRLREEGGAVLGEVAGDVPDERVAAEVAAILSLDVDGSGFPEIGRRDPVVGELQELLPGLRPVLFWSPYEAAAWAIIGQRIRMPQAARVKRRLAEELGETVDAGGTRVPAFPAPERLAALPPGQAGLNARKEEQLRALGRAALEGRLGRTRLRALGEDAAAALQELPGIGPFSAELIRIRGAGDPDAFPAHERRVAALMRTRYGLGEDAGPDELLRIAEAWRPYRSWVTLLLRAA